LRIGFRVKTTDDMDSPSVSKAIEEYHFFWFSRRWEKDKLICKEGSGVWKMTKTEGANEIDLHVSKEWQRSDDFTFETENPGTGKKGSN